MNDKTELTHEQRMRLNALEFASSMYMNRDGNKAEEFIAFANEVYKYLKEGSTRNDDEIKF